MGSLHSVGLPAPKEGVRCAHRIMIVAQLPPPVHGSNVMARLAYDALNQKGYSVTLVSRAFSSTLDEVGRFRLSKPFRLIVLMRRLTRRAREERPDLCLYYLAAKPPAVWADALALRVAQLRGIPCVCYLHGQGLRRYDAEGGWWGRRLVRTALRSCVGAIVLGEALKDDVDFAIDRSRLIVVPNALPNDSLPTPPPRTTPEKRVLFLSNLIPFKGAHELVRAMAMIRSRAGPFIVKIAGAPKDLRYAHELSRLIRDLRLEGVVELCGAVYGEDKARLFAEADLFVLPTRNDTFALVVLEAMRAGVPVIATRQGALPELVRDGVNGYLIDPDNIAELADRIFTLLSNESLRASMGRKGRETYEAGYTYEKYADRLDAAVQHFLALAKRAEKSRETAGRASASELADGGETG